MDGKSNQIKNMRSSSNSIILEFSSLQPKNIESLPFHLAFLVGYSPNKWLWSDGVLYRNALILSYIKHIDLSVAQSFTQLHSNEATNPYASPWKFMQITLCLAEYEMVYFQKWYMHIIDLSAIKSTCYIYENVVQCIWCVALAREHQLSMWQSVSKNMKIKLEFVEHKKCVHRFSY